jgi:hypothetical protein
VCRSRSSYSKGLAWKWVCGPHAGQPIHHHHHHHHHHHAYPDLLQTLTNKTNSVALVHERTIPTERPPLVGEVSGNFCG